jgi:hypothetical protein
VRILNIFPVPTSLNALQMWWMKNLTVHYWLIK